MGETMKVTPMQVRAARLIVAINERRGVPTREGVRRIARAEPAELDGGSAEAQVSPPSERTSA